MFHRTPINIQKIWGLRGVHSYDLVVVGGHPGGLAAAQEALGLGAKVAIVTSPLYGWNPTWETGIAKYLAGRAAELGQHLADAHHFGWKVPTASDVQYSWEMLKKLQQGNANETCPPVICNYVKATARFESPHSLLLSAISNGAEGVSVVTSRNFLIAVGSTARFPNVPGALEHATAAHDLLKADKPPGKTLVVGAGCVGLECAGILKSLGYDTTVLVRSVPLRGFDRQMVGFLIAEMESRGVKFLRKRILTHIQKLHDGGQLHVGFTNSVDRHESDVFDSVVVAIGTKPLIDDLQLDKAQVKTVGGKIQTNQDDRSNVPHIFAIGDAVYGRPERVPVTEKAGRLLSRRLFRSNTATMDYDTVARSVATPLEYAFVGLSEERALERFGATNVEVFHSFYRPPEFGVTKRNAANCYLKVVALKEDRQEVLGMHFLGPGAADIVQSFSTAVRCKLTVPALVNTVGVHPTLAEEFTRISITKRSGRDPTPASCCS